MSPRLPAVTGKDVVRAAQRLGFDFRRQTGSHTIYVRPTDHARVVIPMHRGVAIKRKTLRGIIEDLKLTVEEFSKLLHE
jgi:predicted RNA binding protein YcfA (HicA-like mRNA interferase family)